MRGRTIILVSHHVQLCAPGAGFVVVLDNGRVQFQGDRGTFQASGIIRSLVQSGGADVEDDQDRVQSSSGNNKEHSPDSDDTADPSSETSSTTAAATEPEIKLAAKKGPRKLVEEEKRAVGRIGRDIWLTYIKACGGSFFWAIFIISLLLAALSPVFENGWLRQVYLSFFLKFP
jgi:ABC-type glutathione transport system ATPase component